MSHSSRVRAEIASLQALKDAQCFLCATANLHAWSNPPQVETPAEHDLYRERCRVLQEALDVARNDSKSSQFAYQLVQLLQAIEARMVDFNAVEELPAGQDRALARYMVSNKRFRDIPEHVCWMEARNAGLLRKRLVSTEGEGAFAFYVVGLRYKVATDSTTVDRRGRDHLNYVKPAGLQAIRVTQDLPFYGDDAHKFAASIPDLPSGWLLVHAGTCRGDVRTISLSDPETETVAGVLFKSRHYDDPLLDDEGEGDALQDAPSTAVPGPMLPAATDLFGAVCLAA